MVALPALGAVAARLVPPRDEVCALRSVLRHRDTLIKTAARSVLHDTRPGVVQDMLGNEVVDEASHLVGGGGDCLRSPEAARLRRK